MALLGQPDYSSIWSHSLWYTVSRILLLSECEDMTRKINRLEDWITADKAAHLLSEKMGFPIESRYIRQLAKRKRQPVRTQSLGYHQLYNREDIQAATVKRKLV